MRKDASSGWIEPHARYRVWSRVCRLDFIPHSSLWLGALRHAGASALYTVTLCLSDSLTGVPVSGCPPLWLILFSIAGLLFLQFCSLHSPTTRASVVPTASWMHFKLPNVAVNVLHHLASTCPSSFISRCSCCSTSFLSCFHSPACIIPLTLPLVFPSTSFQSSGILLTPPRISHLATPYT